MKRRIIALFISIVMVLGLVACGGTGESKTSKENEEKKSAEQVSGPITIEFWHVRGSGANGTNMTKMVEYKKEVIFSSLFLFKINLKLYLTYK